MQLTDTAFRKRTKANNQRQRDLSQQVPATYHKR